jgi:hypothetical protein
MRHQRAVFRVHTVLLDLHSRSRSDWALVLFRLKEECEVHCAREDIKYRQKFYVSATSAGSLPMSSVEGLHLSGNHSSTPSKGGSSGIRSVEKSYIFDILVWVMLWWN